MFRKGKSAVEGDPKKSWNWMELRLGCRLAWWESTEENEASQLLGLRGRHQYSDQHSKQIRAPRVTSIAVGTEGGGGPNGQIVSVKRAANGRKQRRRKIIDEKREKYRAKNGSLRSTSTDAKGAAFVILINHASAPIQKEKI